MAFQLKDLDSNKVIELKSGDIIGRSEGNHKFPECTKMSRSHCQFIMEGNVAYILDLNSRNGTFVNSVKIEPNKKTIMGDGHILMFGDKSFMLRGGSSGGVNTMIPGVTGEAGGKMSTPIKSYAFSFKAKTSELYGLLLKNIVFTLLTLGLYIPYARTNLRKFIWKSSSLNSFPFLFKGNPQALLKSYSILLVIFVAMSAINHAITTFVVKGDVILTYVHAFITYTVIFVVFTWAKYGAYSYLVNNSSYRSVHFKMNKGGAKNHLLHSILGTILSILTLGIYYPFMACKLEKIRWNKTQYGTSPFTYFAEGGEYAKLWFKGVILTLLTAGLYYPWFAISMHKYKIDSLEFGTATFISKATGGEYFWVLFKSALLMIVTLGLAAPFVFNLNLAYFLNHTSIKGSINFDDVVAAAKVKQSGLSDSVADVFDLDVDIGIT
jgi:uncharacterized membrane protein YjgN (DUF898 family)